MRIIITLLAVLTTSIRAQQDEPLTLEYASLVFRHGARSPGATYPNDPWPPKSWPQGLGQLNWNGTRMHFYLGELVKKRFTVENKLLSPNYYRDEVYVRSTDYDRTLMSVLSQLSAIFPPDEDRKLNGTIDWQPIPPHTIPQDTDNLLLGFTPFLCPRLEQLVMLTMETDYYKQLVEQYKEFFEYVEKSTGVGFKLNPYIIALIADTVIVELEWGRDPGDWVNDTIANTLKVLYEETIYLTYDAAFAKEKQRLTMGTLIKEMVDRMMNKSQGDDETLTPGSRVKFYSAHDYTVGGLLNAFGAYDRKSPPYASTIFVELLSDSSIRKNYFVRTSYLENNTVDGFNLTNTSALLRPLSVRGCDLVCPLENFTALLKDFIPDDLNEECKIQNYTVCEAGVITGNVEYDPRSEVATLTFSGAHEYATTTCKLDNGPPIKCANSANFGVFKRGKRSITVKSVCPGGSTYRKFKFRV